MWLWHILFFPIRVLIAIEIVALILLASPFIAIGLLLTASEPSITEAA